jgi:hypothetical protein
VRSFANRGPSCRLHRGQAAKAHVGRARPARAAMRSKASRGRAAAGASPLPSRSQNWMSAPGLMSAAAQAGNRGCCECPNPARAGNVGFRARMQAPSGFRRVPESPALRPLPFRTRVRAGGDSGMADDPMVAERGALTAPAKARNLAVRRADVTGNSPGSVWARTSGRRLG